MDSLQQKLLGELVGLARATEGNEHLITADSTAVVIACLRAGPASKEELEIYLNKVVEMKEIMVPDCFLCANPCGRTSSYDLTRMDREEPEIQKIKYRIIGELQAIAQRKLDRKQEECLYRGLVALGLEGYSAAALYSIFTG